MCCFELRFGVLFSFGLQGKRLVMLPWNSCLVNWVLYLLSLFLPQEAGTCGAGGVPAALVTGYTAVLYPSIFGLGGIILPS